MAIITLTKCVSMSRKHDFQSMKVFYVHLSKVSKTVIVREHGRWYAQMINEIFIGSL